MNKVMSLSLLYFFLQYTNVFLFEEYGLERRRIAALSLPFLMNRAVASIRTYISDAPLRGMMPFPR